MAKTDGQIVLSLDIAQTKNNIQTELNTLIKGIKVSPITLEVGFNQKEFKEASASINKLKNQLSILENAKRNVETFLPTKNITTRDGMVEKIDKAIQSYDNLIKKEEQLKALRSQSGNHTSQRENINQTKKDIEVLTAEVNNVDKTFLKMGNTDYFEKLETRIVNTQTKIQELSKKWSAFLKDKSLKAEYKQLEDLSKNIFSEKDLINVKRRLADFSQNVKAAGKDTVGLGGELKKSFAHFTQFFGVSRLWYEAITAAKQMITNVRELDSAMVELRKVSDASEVQLSNFFKNTKNEAVALGTTMKDLINATADFSRLGFSLKEAETLAKTATIYATVGDDIQDINQATTSIISTMKGFNIDPKNADSIIDKFNEVGKQICPAA